MSKIFWYAHEVRGAGRHEYGVSKLAAHAWKALVADVRSVVASGGVDFLRVGTVDAPNQEAAMDKVRLGEFTDPTTNFTIEDILGGVSRE